MDELINSFSSVNMNMPEDEYQQLMEGYYAMPDNVHIVKKAYERYKRYVKCLDLSLYPVLEKRILDFIHGERTYDQMKKVDIMIVRMLGY
jgi:hypothetical protein